MHLLRFASQYVPIRTPPGASGLLALRQWTLAGGDWLAARLDAERDVWFAWMPVIFAVGIAAYFSLPEEPSGWALVGAGALAAWLLGRVRHLHGGGFALAVVVLAAAAGFCAAGVKARWVETPVLSAPLERVGMEGVILSYEPRRGQEEGARRIRYILAPDFIEGVKAEETPRLVRFTHGDKEILLPGQRARMFGTLFPLSGPVEPGSFYYARQIWFEGIGATGFAYYLEAQDRTGEEMLSWGERFRIQVERVRAKILNRLEQHLSGDAAGIAAALIIGERGLLSRDAVVSLRDAGLAHILAISGLHMALVAGGVFWVVARGLAWFPPLALRHPLYKWGAAAALLAAVAYLLLSGASIATKRAFLMVLVGMLALLSERSVISTRNVALAALATLALWPQTLLSAGFQMSFAATLALVAVYEGGLYQAATLRWVWRFVPERSRQDAPLLRRVAWGLSVFLITLFVTSFVAGLVTSFFIAHHFHRIAPYGLLGNMLAMPIFIAWVMPMVLLSMLAMPLGLEAVPLMLLGRGGEMIIALAAWVSGLPRANLLVGASAPWLLPCFALSLCWLCLWRGQWRWLGAAGILLAFSLLGQAERPKVLIDDRARTAAVLGENGWRESARPRSARFDLDIWRRRDGMLAPPAERQEVWRCAEEVCSAELPSGGLIVHAAEDADATAVCALQAEILVTPLTGMEGCAAHLVDANATHRHGAHAFYWREGTWEVVRAKTVIGNRPWN